MFCIQYSCANAGSNCFSRSLRGEQRALLAQSDQIPCHQFLLVPPLIVPPATALGIAGNLRLWLSENGITRIWHVSCTIEISATVPISRQRSYPRFLQVKMSFVTPDHKIHTFHVVKRIFAHRPRQICDGVGMKFRPNCKSKEFFNFFRLRHNCFQLLPPSLLTKYALDEKCHCKLST